MNKTALLVLDFINDIVHHESKSVAIASYVKEHQVIENANKTIAFARLHKIPVVFVRVGFRMSCALASVWPGERVPDFAIGYMGYRIS
jgi:nicotinamidase-related amidase